MPTSEYFSLKPSKTKNVEYYKSPDCYTEHLVPASTSEQNFFNLKLRKEFDS
jgi:hypothetical protein